MFKHAPRAEPKLWHEQSVAAWDAFYLRNEPGRRERKKIRAAWDARMDKQEAKQIEKTKERKDKKK